jgi:SagB-type dehydrogenase family enzyme
MIRSIALPEPNKKGAVSLEEALNARRSVRQFSSQLLTPSQISQLLWAAQGLTNAMGLRTVPSAGARYALEIYIIDDQGVFHYHPDDHRLSTYKEGDLRKDVCRAALDQDSILQAPGTMVLTAVFDRIAERYSPERARRYVFMEVGHAAQNVLLQAQALGLGAVPIGAFEDEALHAVLALPPDHKPLYLIPIGHPR